MFEIEQFKTNHRNNQNLLINTNKQAIFKANEKIQLSIGEATIQSDGREILLQVGSAKIIIKNGEIIMQGKVNIMVVLYPALRLLL